MVPSAVIDSGMPIVDALKVLLTLVLLHDICSTCKLLNIIYVVTGRFEVSTGFPRGLYRRRLQILKPCSAQVPPWSNVLKQSPR